MKEPLGPERDGDKLIGRKIPNQFNIRETVVMPKGAWDYLDWLDSEGYDVTKWVRKIDANREPDKTYGEYLLERVWVTWCHRYRTGQKCPGNTAPRDYDEYLELLEERGLDTTETEYVEPTVN